MSDVLAWIDAPPGARGISVFSEAAGDWVRTSYEELAAMVRTTASALAAEHVPGAAIVVVSEEPLQQAVTFYGALYAGLRPCLLAPPGPLGNRYGEHVRATVAVLEPAAIYVDDRFRRQIAEAFADAPAPPAAVALHLAPRGGHELSGARAPAGARILQLTSGSSGTAKAVTLDLAGVGEHVAAIHDWLGTTETDRPASWLPLHHDMGLIGMLVAPVTMGLDLDLMTPTQFIRSPARYLACFGRRGATLTAMPTFGLRHITRRVAAERLVDLDLRSWRILIVGAERVAADVLVDFERLLAPAGFSGLALCPAYGMAEATLAVSGVAPDEPWEATDSVPGRAGHGPATRIVSCGLPLCGRDVVVLDDDGREVGEGVVGEIEVRGGSIGERLPGGNGHPPDRHRTGDSGFLLRGQVYPLGRLGDSCKLNGKTVFAEDVEERLVAEGIDPLRCCALLGYGPAGSRVVILLERPPEAWVVAAERVAATMFADGEYRVLAAPGRSISRTSSGKPRRRELWSRYGTSGFDDEPNVDIAPE